MNKVKVILIVAIVVAILFYLIFGGGAKMGETAPEIRTELISGESFGISDLKGDYVLLDFWGSWCGPCIKEAPALVSFYNTYKDQEFQNGAKFHVVSIALEKNDKRWQRAAERMGFTWHHQIVDISSAVMMSDYARKYGVSNIPHKFLIDPNGDVIGNNMSFSDMSELLDKEKL